MKVINFLSRKIIHVIILIFSIFNYNHIKSQETYPTISVGYTYQNQNWGEIGGKLIFTQKEKDNIIVRTGASAMMGVSNKKFAVMPKIQADILFSPRKDDEVFIAHSLYYILGLETTNKYLAPYTGINILGILDFTAGYSFSFDNHINGKKLHGIKLGIMINIPTIAIDNK